MTGKLSRRALLAGGVALMATPGLARPVSTSLRPRLRGSQSTPPQLPTAEDLVAAAKVPGDTSYVLMDAQGTVLRSRGAERATPPASVAKIITALYALDRLGKAYRFETRLHAIGLVEEGTLFGDLVLVGGGDPTLTTDDLAALVDSLQAAGIQKVAGRFLIYQEALPYVASIEPGQPSWLGYSPAVSGLNLNFNRVHFEWTPLGGSYSLAMEARGRTASPRVGMARMQIVTRGAPVFEYTSQPGVDLWTVARSALGKGGARWLPVRFPGLYAGDAFRGIARARGIAMPTVQVLPFVPDGAPLAVHQSAPIEDICRDMLKRSTNLTAEVLGLTASGGNVPDLAASASEMNRWAAERLGAEIDMVDHSGLSDQSRVSAKAMGRVLAAAVDGPLSDLMKPVRFAAKRAVPGFVSAKTGTLNYVSGLGGYIDTGSDRHIFAIFSSDLEARAEIAPLDREKPRGATGWLRRAKRLEIDLVDHWAKRLSQRPG